MTKPLAIDLYCGLGGWADGLIAEGYDVVGFDITRHIYGEHRYPGQLVLQDVLTLHGSQFRNATLIVASPPCQAYSYRAMPWKKAKALPPPDNTLFDACFRIQREACEAAGRHIPLIVENVRGAQKWVGRARWNFGSFYLWGDVPALMPMTLRAPYTGGIDDWRATKNSGGSWFNIANNTTSGKGQNPDGRKVPTIGTGRSPAPGNGERFTTRDCGTKNGNDWFGPGTDCSLQRRHGSKPLGRKFASAMIAKIPLPLARHIGATFKPAKAKAA